VNLTRVLSMAEVVQVVKDLRKKRKSPRKANANLNIAIFRLACCCGLRRSEMVQLRIRDVALDGTRPCIRARRMTTKGKLKGRIVPLWWDKETVADLRVWLEYRRKMPGTNGGPCTPDSLFLAGVCQRNRGRAVTDGKAAVRWRTAIKCLGPERRRQVSIHGGRHTFASMALAAGHSLMEVKEALGHSCIATTSIYLHLIERENLPDLFASVQPEPPKYCGWPAGKPRKPKPVEDQPQPTA
jgi:integrase